MYVWSIPVQGLASSARLSTAAKHPIRACKWLEAYWHMPRVLLESLRMQMESEMEMETETGSRVSTAASISVTFHQTTEDDASAVTGSSTHYESHEMRDSCLSKAPVGYPGGSWGVHCQGGVLLQNMYLTAVAWAANCPSAS